MSAEDQIRQYAERIVRLEQERKSLAEDIKECKAEAKAAGFSPKLIATCVRIMLMEAEKRAEALAGHEELDLYLSAVGLVSSGERQSPAPVREHHHDYDSRAQTRSAVRDEVITSEPEEIRPSVAGSSAGEPSLLRKAETGAKRESAASVSAPQVSRNSASGMVGGFPVPATPLSRGGAGSERTDIQSVTARRDGTFHSHVGEP